MAKKENIEDYNPMNSIVPEDRRGGVKKPKDSDEKPASEDKNHGKDEEVKEVQAPDLSSLKRNKKSTESVRIREDLYQKIKKEAQKLDRPITELLDILLEYAIEATFNKKK